MEYEPLTTTGARTVMAHVDTLTFDDFAAPDETKAPVRRCAYFRLTRKIAPPESSEISTEPSV